MRVANSVHRSRPWRIHEIAQEFRLEDVWELPTPGGAEDFPRLVRQMSSGEPGESSSRVARALWAIRWKLGELLDWDTADVVERRASLREHLPDDLGESPRGPGFDAAPFTSLYLLDDEWAAEIVNRTVHGILHVGWVRDENGGYRGEMAVYVKPDGVLGTVYMAAIRPLRYLIVYPALLRQVEREWRASTGDEHRPVRA
jgi:Protein of unknown function (DUF2867)